MTIITNASKQALLPSSQELQALKKVHDCDKRKHFYYLEGIGQNSAELIFGNLSSPLPLLRNQELQIWYGQDWIDLSEDNNSGATCVDVYAWYI